MIKDASSLSSSVCFLEDDAMADWKRLGKTVVARRVNLGYRTQGDFAELLGLTTRVLGDIENGRRDNYDRATIATLEQALGWETGSVDAILDGREPTPLHLTGSFSRATRISPTTDTDAIDLIARSTTMSAREKLERIRLVLELQAQVEAEERAQQKAPAPEDTGAQPDRA